MDAPSLADVTVIVVTYNAEGDIDRCLDALERQSLGSPSIIVADNGSTDGTLDRIRARPRPVRLVELGSNAGFARANNVAAAIADTPWIALLNPDAFPEPDWLEQLLGATRRHPQAAAFGSTQLDDTAPSRLDGAGDVYHVTGLVWRGGYGAPRTALPEADIFSACAAAALYRRDVFQALGGFDERYFCYCEDVDLGFRLRLGGYDCIHVPAAVVRHRGSASSGRHSDFAVYHGVRNRLWTFIKNMPLVLLLPLLPLHLLAGAAHAALLRRNGAGNAALRGLGDGLREGWTVFRSRCRPKDFRSLRRTLAAMAWSPWSPFRRTPRFLRPQSRPSRPLPGRAGDRMAAP